MIPLLMIPQMVLGGAMFTFDKLNKDFTSVDKVPFIAEFIPARYAYEGLIVHQYKHNKFKQKFFDIEMTESKADFKQVYYLPELRNILESVKLKYDMEKVEDRSYEADLKLLNNELGKEMRRQPEIEFKYLDKLIPTEFNEQIYSKTLDYIDQLNELYGSVFLTANTKREQMTQYLLENQKELYDALKDDYFNETVSDIVRKTFDKNKILRDGDKLIQIIDPIYQMPEPEGLLSFRTHFFAPSKYFAGRYWDTLWFNIASVWFLTICLYFVLYFDLVRKGFEYIGEIEFKKRFDKLKSLFNFTKRSNNKK